MGIGNGIFVILEANIPWGKELDRTPGSERERDRVRYPSFQNRHAPALRFGSMNPISRVLGHGASGGKLQRPRIPLGIWAKVIMYGGYVRGVLYCRNGI